MMSLFLQKINIIKNEFFMNFWKKDVPGDEIERRDEITGFDGTDNTSLNAHHMSSLPIAISQMSE